MPAPRKFKRRMFVAFFFALLVFGLIMLWGDFQKNYKDIVGFRWRFLPLALCLAFVNFTLRELKWDFFRRQAGVKAPRLGSALIYFSGYSMCVSPGRIGELIKPMMYKDYLKTRLTKTIPLVFCERLTDLLGMVFICGITVAYFIRSVDVARDEAGAEGAVGNAAMSNSTIAFYLILSVVILAVLIGMMRWRRLVHACLEILAGMGAKGAQAAEKLEHLYDSTYPLLTARNLILMTLFAACSWCFEGLATFVLSYYGLGIHVDFINVLFIFYLSSIVGGLLFFLPGGMGGFEPIMIACFALLNARGQVITILCRFATLFFGAFVGVVAIVFTTRYFHESVHWDELEHLDEEAEAEFVEEDGAAEPAPSRPGE